jgi:predicted MFS family arabinose efflux permease
MWGLVPYAHAYGMTTLTFTKPHVRLPGGRPFHLLLASLAVSSCGDWLYNVALLAFVYERTRSATWLAATTAARVIPIVVLGPIGGVLADRWNRRRLIVASDLSRAVAMIALAVVAASGMPVVLAALLAAVSTAAGVVQPPCVAACTPRLVAPDELQRANAARAAIGQGSIVAGPALGALLLGLSSPAVAIALNAASFLASAAAVTAIGSSAAFVPSRADGGPLRLGRELREGAQALRAAPAAVRLVAADVLCSATYGLLTVTLVLVSMRVGAGTGGYGLLLGMFGIGGVVGAVVAGKLDAPEMWRRMLLVALGLVAVAVAALGLVHSLVAAIVVSLAGGGGMIVAEVLSETALGRMLDDGVLARAYGLALPASLSGIVIGSLIAGPLVATVGVTDTFLVAGLGLALAGGLVLRHPLRDSGAATVAVAAPAM